MKDILTIFSYTFYENARKKVFIIATVIILLFTIIAFSIPGLIKYFENNDKSPDKQTVASTDKKGIVYVVDSKGIFKDDMAKFSENFSGYDFKLSTPDKISSLQEAIKTESDKSLVVIDEKDGIPFFGYWVKKDGDGISSYDLSKAMKSIFVKKLLLAPGISDNTTEKVLKDVEFNYKILGRGNTSNYVSSMVIVMLLFFAVYFYGYGVCMSVASEKTSRVMEILLTSSKPSKIIIGKSSAMGILGLSQLSAIIIAAVITSKINFPKDFTIGGESVSLSGFTPLILIMVIVYFILGYSLYAMMNAVAGATVSKTEDLNSAIMPISLITMVSFYLAYGSVAIPDGTVSIVSSIVPFSAPFSMPSRMLMTDVPIWQIAVSLLSMIASIIFMGWTSIKLYSHAVLHYGKRLKLMDLIKATK